jgi:RNA polymerase sigma-70 factor (ECF subfamily)
MPVTDAVLVARARGGDRDAFATLVARHHATLVRCCRRMVGGDAADVAQDAVLTAMLSLDRLRDPQKFGAWLVGIGLNASRAQLRERRGLGADPPVSARRSATAEGSDPGSDPHEAAESAEVAALVRAAIAELPPGQREAVTLYYLAGLTQAEAAAHLGIPPGAVKTRLHKARASLRTRLRPLEREHRMVQMEVTDVRRAGEEHIIMLAGGGHDLKIWVGGSEARAVAVALEAVELPRPTSYDLTASLLKAGGTAVREVRVSRLVEHTFYGEVVLADGTAVDARPSDAINLALVTGAPILVDERVFAAAERIDPEWAEERAAAEASTEDRRVLAEEVRERVSRLR